MTASSVTEAERNDIEEKVLFTLRTFPVISATMLQGALGPHTKPLLWRPIVNDMVTSGKIEERIMSRVTPNGRHATTTIMCLPHTVVTINGEVVFNVDAL